MAPIKFEENIREKLEQRSLQPSTNAWQSLEQKLNADTKKRNKNKFWWFGIAAGFIGLLFIVQQFVSINNTNQVIPTIIVESESDTLNKQIEAPLVIEEPLQVVQAQPEEAPTNIKSNTASAFVTTANSAKTKEQASLKVSVIAKNEDTPSVLKTEIISEDDVTTSIANVTDPLPNNVTQITALETSGSEIEALLKAATKDIQLSDNNKTIKAVSIDANALLEDVETEMPPSLRGQLFKVIEKNFKAAKTAIATRNE